MTRPPEELAARLRRLGAEVDLTRGLAPAGYVRRVGDGVAFATGLRQVGYEEMVEFESGALGLAYDLSPSGVGVLLLSHSERVQAGEIVRPLGEPPSLAAGDALLGRVVDPLGTPLDDGPELYGAQRRPLLGGALEFVDRKSVDEPLLTGVMTLDAAIPIGRGQRELIVGDRNTGKTALAEDVVAAQSGGDVVCIYSIIGQPMSRVLSLRETLLTAGCLDNTAIVAAHAGTSPGMQFLAPYAGAALAEFFRDQGRHALVVYDDLTKHADSYRELALLLDRPPGREAFPGDIFHIHAQLLERAAARSKDKGGGTVTALPIVETTDGDISAYIPTNLISITDGQIYLDADRFERNQRPAIDVGRSVSRIGAAAQPEPLRKASANLRILLSRFESLEGLTRVGLDVDPATQATLRRGQVMRELLQQGRFDNRGLFEQVVTLTAVSEGWLDKTEPSQARERVSKGVRQARAALPELAREIDAGNLPAAGWEARVSPFFAVEGEESV